MHMKEPKPGILATWFRREADTPHFQVLKFILLITIFMTTTSIHYATECVLTSAMHMKEPKPGILATWFRRVADTPHSQVLKFILLITIFMTTTSIHYATECVLTSAMHMKEPKPGILASLV
ncbi:hypothetical protein AVEN_262755-1 [Araneus ventricosus]|uniref:Uncharacterized protein n=1 Tax=Araneus ventricosus TaxID=182803 RepID=A0A4Y2PSB3_ARAVE|nr:hypothetical protein AVEN_262755-1 [Araneus ventricosus]